MGNGAGESPGRQMGIKAQWVKPYVQTTIDSDFSSKLHNILNEQFNPAQPDAVWVSDITYIWTFDGFVYLTSIMDLYSRKIIAWVLGEIPCGGMYRESKENPQNSTSAYHTYRPWLPVCIGCIP